MLSWRDKCTSLAVATGSAVFPQMNEGTHRLLLSRDVSGLSSAISSSEVQSLNIVFAMAFFQSSCVQ